MLAEKNDADYITSSAVMVGHHSMQSEGCSIGCGQMQHVCFLPHYHVDVMYVLMQVASISDIYCNSKPSCVLISMMCRFFSQFLYTTERHCGPIIILVFLHMLLLANVLDCVCAIITNVNRHSYNNFVVLSVGILRTSSSIGGMMLEPQMFANIAICVMLPIHCGPFFSDHCIFEHFQSNPLSSCACDGFRYSGFMCCTHFIFVWSLNQLLSIVHIGVMFPKFVIMLESVFVC